MLPSSLGLQNIIFRFLDWRKDGAIGVFERVKQILPPDESNVEILGFRP
jgi:hypothetical protein